MFVHLRQLNHAPAGCGAGDAEASSSTVSTKSSMCSSPRVFVRNTFIEVEEHSTASDIDDVPAVRQRSASEPPASSRARSRVLCTSSIEITSQRARHLSGNCKPCAYYFQKEDGCRQGTSCPFCHMCPPGEFKKRKKNKLKLMRAEARRLRAKEEEAVPARPNARERRSLLHRKPR
mmetsp:Transcript_74207/g.206249  ORF Transcript_74207/g.206249 Transcript_74207/m.206249 type:complete len:176 (-) Transcript_74207:68-595(-)